MVLRRFLRAALARSRWQPLSVASPTYKMIGLGTINAPAGNDRWREFM